MLGRSSRHLGFQTQATFRVTGISAITSLLTLKLAIGVKNKMLNTMLFSRNFRINLAKKRAEGTGKYSSPWPSSSKLGIPTNVGAITTK